MGAQGRNDGPDYRTDLSRVTRGQSKAGSLMSQRILRRTYLTQEYDRVTKCRIIYVSTSPKLSRGLFITGLVTRL